MFLHVLTIVGSRGSCFNTRPPDRVFKLLQSGPANVNALKQTCVIVILTFYITPGTLKSKMPKNHKIVHCTPQLTSFLLFLTPFREEYNDVNVNKNRDKMLTPGQPCIVVWRHVNNRRPVSRIFKKKHGQSSSTTHQAAHKSHDFNIVLVVWKPLLVDLKMCSSSCMHRYLCKNIILAL